MSTYIQFKSTYQIFKTLVFLICLTFVFIFSNTYVFSKPINIGVESSETPEVKMIKPIPYVPYEDTKITIPTLRTVFQSTSSMLVQEVNLIQNPSVETSGSSGLPSGWSKGGYGTNQRTFTYLSTGHNSSKAIKININSYTSGDAKWYFSDVPVNPGDTYIFYDYYISNIPSTIDVRYTMEDGSYKYTDISYVEANPGPDYKKVLTEFVVPEKAVSVTIFHLISKVGFLTTDEFSLTKVSGTVPPDPDPKNLILNPDFEKVDTSGLPVNWKKGGWGTNSKSFIYPIVSYDGSKAVSLKVTSYTSGDAKWYFNPISLLAGNYTYSDNYSSNLNSVVTVQFRNSNGTYSYKDIAKLASSSSFTSVSVDFSVPSGTQDVTIFHLIQGVGYLSIDNVGLYAKDGSIDNGIFNTGAVTFRFDDGWLSQYQNAIPKLNSFGYKGTFFIVTDRLAVNDPDFYTLSELTTIKNQGHEIGAHTKTHPDLTLLTPQQQLDEIQGSKNDLTSMGLGPITSFSYPFGSYDTSIVQMVKNSGFSSAVSVIDGYVSPVSDKYQLERREVVLTTTISQIKKMIDDAALNKSWLIFEMHQINNSGELYSTTKSIFDQTIDYVKLKNIPVVTIDQGIKSM